MTFGEKLQELRKARGWSQEELAGQIHVSRQALSKWESGGAVPDTENIIALSRLFGVTTDYLLLDEVRDTGQAAPRAAWPKPRRYLLAAAIVRRGGRGRRAVHLGRRGRRYDRRVHLGRYGPDLGGGYGGCFGSACIAAIYAAVCAEHGVYGAAGGRRHRGDFLLPHSAIVGKVREKGRMTVYITYAFCFRTVDFFAAVW